MLGVSLPCSTLAADGQAVLLVLAQGENETLLSDMITACGLSPNVVERAEYTPAMAESYDYFVLEDAAPLDDILAAGKPALCIGASFADRQWVTLQTLHKTARATMRVYGTAQTVILHPDTVLIADAADGWTTFGSITVEGGTYPMGVMRGDIYYIPTIAEDTLTVFAAAQMLNRYFGLADGGKVFITIDSVTPLHDLSMLTLIADKLYANGLPFLVTLRPIYYNTEYPAFVRYCNALLYMRSKGGSFVMQDPLQTGNELVGDSLEVRTEKAYDAFAAYGITVTSKDGYPLPVSIDFLQTLVPTDGLSIDLPINTTIVYNVFTNEQELDSAILSINQLWLNIGDYTYGSLYSYTPWPVNEAYAYRSSAQQKFASFISQSNSILRILVIFFGLVIIALFLLGWKLYWRRFVKNPNTKAGRNANRHEP